MVKKFFWVLTFFGGLIGGASFFYTLLMAESAPQQAAGAAVALGWVVLPYCFARACDKLDEVPLAKELEGAMSRALEKVVITPMQKQPPTLQNHRRPVPQRNGELDHKLRTSWE